MQESQSPPPDEYRKLRQELSRLRAKLLESKDSDIRAVLQLRIDQIVAEIPRDALIEPKVFAEPEPEAAAEVEQAEIPSATKEQLDEADKLIRQARVEKMRGNASKSTDLLKSAAARRRDRRLCWRHLEMTFWSASS